MVVRKLKKILKLFLMVLVVNITAKAAAYPWVVFHLPKAWGTLGGVFHFMSKREC